MTARARLRVLSGPKEMSLGVLRLARKHLSILWVMCCATVHQTLWWRVDFVLLVCRHAAFLTDRWLNAIVRLLCCCYGSVISRPAQPVSGCFGKHNIRVCVWGGGLRFDMPCQNVHVISGSVGCWSVRRFGMLSTWVTVSWRLTDFQWEHWWKMRWVHM